MFNLSAIINKVDTVVKIKNTIFNDIFLNYAVLVKLSS